MSMNAAKPWLRIARGENVTAEVVTPVVQRTTELSGGGEAAERGQAVRDGLDDVAALGRRRVRRQIVELDLGAAEHRRGLGHHCLIDSSSLTVLRHRGRTLGTLACGQPAGQPCELPVDNS